MIRQTRDNSHLVAGADECPGEMDGSRRCRSDLGWVVLAQKEDVQRPCIGLADRFMLVHFCHAGESTIGKPTTIRTTP